MPITLGNDIVDLEDAQNQINNYRFLNRVFSPQEQQFISNNHTMLWTLWAFKEASFKAYQKQHFNHIFSPIGCQIKSISSQQKQINATVLIKESIIECDGELIDEGKAIHCIASYSTHSINKYVSSIKELMTIHHKIEKINAASYQNQSHAVRMLAAQLFAELNIIGATIKRPLLNMGTYQKKAPPEIFIDGKISDYELSLSHDGCYAAVVIGQAKRKV